MSRLLRLPAVAALLLIPLSVLVASAQAGTTCEQPPQITALMGFSASVRPVVLVHGWDGNGSTMEAIAGALKPLPVRPYIFDYSSHNTDWAARPTIAGCLSKYISAISAAYRAAGGDGKVIVIAHSMGGLAVRFASDSQYTDTPIGGDLGGVITVDTPSLGSPFGDQSLARAMEALPIFGGSHPSSLLHETFEDGFQTPPGSDASICLAIHAPPQNALPHGCDSPPYLPAGIPITQLAGDITLNRSLFGVHLYSIDFASDGPVSVQSAHGYAVSGPGGHAPLGTLSQDQPTLSCGVDLDDAEALAAGAGIGGLAGVAASLPASIDVDNAGVDEELSGHTGKAYDALIAASYLLAPCSHGAMLNWRPSLQVIVSAVTADLRTLAAAQRTSLVQEAPVDQDYMPRPGLTVQSEGTLQNCGAGSDSAGFVYRCFARNGIFDPCWTDAADPQTPAVICQEAPWETTVKRFTFPHGGPPPFLSPESSAPENAPWGVQLSDGERCLAEQGAHDNALGKVVEYACLPGYTHVLLGGMMMTNGVGSFPSAFYESSTNSYRAGSRETVTTAWYAIPDRASEEAAARNTCSGAAIAAAAEQYEAAHKDPDGPLPEEIASSCVHGWALMNFVQDAPPPGYEATMLFRASPQGWQFVGSADYIGPNNNLGLPNGIASQLDHQVGDHQYSEKITF